METPSPWAETQTDTDAMETCLRSVCLSGSPCYFWFSALLHTSAVLFFLFTMLLCFILLYSILLRQDWIHYVAQETTECCCLSTSPNWSYRHEKHCAQPFTRSWDPNCHIQACTASSLPIQPSTQAPRLHSLFCLLEPFAHDFRFFIILSPS